MSENKEEFKVGDPVTCLIYGKQEVIQILGDRDIYPIVCKGISGIYHTYTRGGLYRKDMAKTLYHGHGTFKVEFIENKEPEYEYRWTVSIGDIDLETKKYFTVTNIKSLGWKSAFLIESSKRPVEVNIKS